MSKNPLTGLNELFSGWVYRVPTGYRHDKEATVADVIRHEQELGNDASDPLASYEKLSADHCLWVARTREDAMRYAPLGPGEEPDESTEPIRFWCVGEVAAVDGDGGLLVVNPIVSYLEYQ